jgi:IS30 family transposase
MKYSHFTKNDRIELSILLKKGYSCRDIGDALKKSPSSISREVSGNCVNGEYDFEKANHKAYFKRYRSKWQTMKISLNPKLEKYIMDKLKAGWSPQAIIERLKTENNGKSVISFKLIYQWLNTPTGQHYRKYIVSKRSRWIRRTSGIKKSTIKDRVFIDERPSAINERMQIGDFECDVLGSLKSESERVAGVVDRKTRFLDLQKVNRLRETMSAYKTMLGNHNALSGTMDNGPENASWKRLRIPTYFCDPYSPWQKGTVENTFQRLRRFIPKKARLSDYSNDDISLIADTMNNIPRECLNWKTPKEIFFNLSLEQTYANFQYSPKPFPAIECCTSG